ncbi:MAG: carboxymuconolactone decarboxylase family protein [Bacteroidota bacterium]
MKINALIVVLSFLCFGLSAQNTNADFQKAKTEIEATFGMYPKIFSIMPDYQVPGMWAYFKTVNNPTNAIPLKYRELINLAVAAQIPCDYCIYYHTEAAKAYGATDDEVSEAIVTASSTRAFSMIIQGNQVKLEEFKEEFQQMMAYMAKQAAKN